MFFLVKVRRSGRAPEHAHPQEQMGTYLSGTAEFISGNQKEIVEGGTLYWIRPNEMHTVRVLGDKAAIFPDVFSTP